MCYDRLQKMHSIYLSNKVACGVVVDLKPSRTFWRTDWRLEHNSVYSYFGVYERERGDGERKREGERERGTTQRQHDNNATTTQQQRNSNIAAARTSRAFVFF